MLSIDDSESPKNASKSGPTSLILTKMKPRYSRTFFTVVRPLLASHSPSAVPS